MDLHTTRLKLTGLVGPSKLWDASRDQLLHLIVGDAVEIDLGLFESETTPVASVSNIELITWEVYETALAETLLLPAVTTDAITTVTLANWNAGTHQSATLALADTDTNLEMTTGARQAWAVIYATLTGGNRRVLGAGPIILQRSNAGGTGPAETPDELYPTNAEMAVFLAGVVKFNQAQSLSGEEKTQALVNIGAAPQSQIDEVSGTVDTLISDLASEITDRENGDTATLEAAQEYAASVGGKAKLAPAVAYRYTTGLLAEYFFSDGRGTTVTDASGNGKTIDLAATTSNNYAWNQTGLVLHNGSVDVPSLTGARTVAVLYRVPRNADGFILCGGDNNGSGMFWSSFTTAYTYHSAWGRNVAPLWWGGSSAGPRFNSGGWCLMFMDVNAAKTSQFSFGGRFSSTANRYSKFEIAYAAVWSGTLTDTLRERIFKLCRSHLLSRGAYMHPDDCPRKAYCIPMGGQSNAEGRALLSEVSAPDLAIDTSNAFISTWSSPIPAQMVVGTNHTYTSPGTYLSPAATVAWAHVAGENAAVPIFLVQTAAGSTWMANTGGTDWSIDESAATSWTGTLLKTIWATEAELLNAGIGPVTAVYFGQGEQDATDLTAGQAYGTNVTAWNTKMKQQLGNVPIIYGRIRNLDPLANSTAVAAVRAAQVTIGTTGNNSWIDTDTCTLDAGNVHYNAAGMKTLGELIYEALPTL